jgi:hypothetical protein
MLVVLICSCILMTWKLVVRCNTVDLMIQISTTNVGLGLCDVNAKVN